MMDLLLCEAMDRIGVDDALVKIDALMDPGCVYTDPEALYGAVGGGAAGL